MLKKLFWFCLMVDARFSAAQRFALLAARRAWTMLGSRKNSKPEMLENCGESSPSSAGGIGLRLANAYISDGWHIIEPLAGRQNIGCRCLPCFSRCLAGRIQLEANIMPISKKYLRLEPHVVGTASRIDLNAIRLITRAMIT